MLEGGLDAASIEAIAHRAGVGKATIYRWWPTRGAVAIDAWFHRFQEPLRQAHTSTAAIEFERQLHELVRSFRGSAGHVMAQLIGEAQRDAELASLLRTRWLEPRRDIVRTALREAKRRGEIREDCDVDVVLDQLFGPIYYRLLLGHGAMTDRLAKELVRNVFRGIATEATT